MTDFFLGFIAGLVSLACGIALGACLFPRDSGESSNGVASFIPRSMGRPDNRKALEHRSLERIAEVEQEVLRGRSQGNSGVS